MRLLILAAHERQITQVKFNRDNDLLFSSSADKSVIVWDPETGERLGTFDGHSGTINGIDIDWNTRFLLTASGDQSVRLWNCLNGEPLHKFDLPSRVLSAEFACGDKLFATCTAQFLKEDACVYIFKNPRSHNLDSVDETKTSDSDTQRYLSSEIKIRNVTGEANFRVNKAVWSPLNNEIYALCTDGSVRMIDVHKQRVYNSLTIENELKTKLHNNSEMGATLTDMCYCSDYCSAIVSARTNCAKMFDVHRWGKQRHANALRTYTCDRALNTVTVHPTVDMVAMGGGKTAQQAALDKRAGKYEAVFCHKIYEQQIGKIETGCFSPLNSMCFNSDGSVFALGYEEGQVRVFNMDGDFETQFGRYTKKTFEQTAFENQER